MTDDQEEAGMPLRIGLIGYGTGGRLFHAPYILASDRTVLAGVVTRSPERTRLVEGDAPGTSVYPSLAELAASGVDAVVVSTPPQTRDALVREALGYGLHVVADKPFAPSADAGTDLAEAARSAGLVLNVFHNRREDTDIVTARSVLRSGRIGGVHRLDLRFDLDEPGSLEGGEQGGLLRDLGTHLVDQAILLLGPARSVAADLDIVQTDAGPTDGAFVLSIEHEGGARSYVSATKLSRLVSRELRLHGTQGSYVSDFRDVQTAAVLRGERPSEARTAWGYEEESRWGTLTTSTGERVVVPSEQGDYTRFYDAFAQAVADGTRGPVPAEEGVAVLRVLDAARISDREHRRVAV